MIWLQDFPADFCQIWTLEAVVGFQLQSLSCGSRSELLRESRKIKAQIFPEFLLTQELHVIIVLSVDETLEKQGTCARSEFLHPVSSNSIQLHATVRYFVHTKADISSCMPASFYSWQMWWKWWVTQSFKMTKEQQPWEGILSLLIPCLSGNLKAQRNDVIAEILCFHDYDQELAF